MNVPYCANLVITARCSGSGDRGATAPGGRTRSWLWAQEAEVMRQRPVPGTRFTLTCMRQFVRMDFPARWSAGSMSCACCHDSLSLPTRHFLSISYRYPIDVVLLIATIATCLRHRITHPSNRSSRTHGPNANGHHYQRPRMVMMAILE